MRHTGTRLCSHQFAISPTTYCGICGFRAEFVDFGVGSIPASFEIACVASIPCKRNYVLTQHLLLFVTATFLLGIYFLPVAVVLSGGVKQVTTLP